MKGLAVQKEDSYSLMRGRGIRTVAFLSMSNGPDYAIFTQVYERWRTKESGYSVPADIKVDKLDEYDMSHLRRLKDWLYQTRIKARLEKGKSERKQQKEEENRTRAKVQPHLFSF
jgi:hypothetical protein